MPTAGNPAPARATARYRDLRVAGRSHSARRPFATLGIPYAVRPLLPVVLLLARRPCPRARPGAVHRARRGRRRPSARAPASASSAPTVSARRRCCACSPASNGPIAAPSPARRRRCGSATCPRSPSAADETVRAFLARRTGVTAAEAELERAATALAAGADAGADDATAAALDALPRARRPPTSTRAHGAMAADLGLPERLLDHADRARCRAARRRERRWRRSCSPLRRVAARRADQRPRLRRARAARALRRDLPGGMVVVSHDRAFLERTVTRVLELDEHTRTADRVRRRLAGVPRRQRATARRHAEEDYETYRTERSRLEDRARTQRSGRSQGVAGEEARHVGERQVRPAASG